MIPKRATSRQTSPLDPAKVREMRLAYASPCTCCGKPFTLVDLAKRFGVSPVAVYKIVKRETWKDVE